MHLGLGAEHTTVDAVTPDAPRPLCLTRVHHRGPVSVIDPDIAGTWQVTVNDVGIVAAAPVEREGPAAGPSPGAGAQRVIAGEPAER